MQGITATMDLLTINKNALTRALYSTGMSLKALQKKAHLSNGTLLRAITQNKPVRPATAKKVADALGVDVMSLMNEPTQKGA